MTESNYDKFLRELRERHHETAREAIRKMNELLKEEDSFMSSDDRYDRITKDLRQIWEKETIRRAMPDELKDKERQETGRKGNEIKKQMIAVTNNGSVAVGNDANTASNSPTFQGKEDGNPVREEPSKTELPEDFTNLAGRYGKNYEDMLERSKNNLDFEQAMKNIEIMKQAMAELENVKGKLESTELEKGKLQEQLKEQSEHFHSTLKAINDNKNKSVTETKEYQAVKSELYIANERISELEQIESKRMKDHPSQTFQSAANIPGITTMTTTIPNEVEFPARDLSTFFLDSRNASKVMYLKLDGKNVVGWESDVKRAKNTANK